MQGIGCPGVGVGEDVGVGVGVIVGVGVGVGGLGLGTQRVPSQQPLAPQSQPIVRTWRQIGFVIAAVEQRSAQELVNWRQVPPAF